MRWIRYVVVGLLLYGINNNQQLYSSSAKQKGEDQRVVKLQNYLLSKKSPLAKSAISFVKAADQYGLDWKLLPAIAGVESGFETAGNLSDYNPFGYMCSNSPCVFDSYEKAIYRVGKTISRGGAYQKYSDSGQISDLAIPYNYVSPEDWTEKIQFFMNKLK